MCEQKKQAFFILAKYMGDGTACALPKGKVKARTPSPFLFY